MPCVGWTRESSRGYAFDSALSDSLSLSREAPDVREKECRAAASATAAAARASKIRASVVIIFYNELSSVLLRSVVSVLNRSDPELLARIIVVDDASDTTGADYRDGGGGGEGGDGEATRDHRELGVELSRHIAELDRAASAGGRAQRVRLLRLGERHGLMRARAAGADEAAAMARAAGEDGGRHALVFLDSHVEASPGWLDPLLAQLGDRSTTTDNKSYSRDVIVPSIDSIDANSFQYNRGGIGTLG